MARTIQFKGAFTVLDATGKNIETNKSVLVTLSVNQKVDLLEVFPVGTPDTLLPMNGLAQLSAVYLNPDAPITVKYNSSAAPPCVVSGPTVLFGTYTAIYVSTPGAVAPVTLEAILAGP